MRAHLATVVAVLTAFGVAGCSGGSSSPDVAAPDSTTPSVTSPTPTTSSAAPTPLMLAHHYQMAGSTIRSHSGPAKGSKFTGTANIGSSCGNVNCSATLLSHQTGKGGGITHATLRYAGSTFRYTLKPVNGACPNGGVWRYTGHGMLRVVHASQSGLVTELRGHLTFEAIPDAKAKKNNCLLGKWTDEVSYGTS